MWVGVISISASHSATAQLLWSLPHWFATLLIYYWSINSIHLTHCFWQISVCVYISGCIITNKLILLRMFGLFSENNTLHFYFSKLAHENYQLGHVAHSVWHTMDSNSLPSCSYSFITLTLFWNLALYPSGCLRYISVTMEVLPLHCRVLTYLECVSTVCADRSKYNELANS